MGRSCLGPGCHCRSRSIRARVRSPCLGWTGGWANLSWFSWEYQEKKSLATCSVVLWRWRKRLIHGELIMAQITQGGSPLPKARIGDSSLMSTPTAPPDRFSHDRGHAFLMGCRRPWFGRLGRWRKRPTPFDREVHTPSPCPYWR